MSRWFASLFVVALLLGISTSASAAEKSVDGTLKTLLMGIETGDYALFTTNSTPEFSARMTKPLLVRVNAELGPRLKKGYNFEFLAILRQQGNVYYLYKISFKDGGDDLTARLSLDNAGKVSGFLIP